MKCPKCNMEIKDDVKTCIFCGALIDSSTPSVEQSVPASNNNLCPKCNSPIGEGKHFCTNCGFRVTDLEINSQMKQSGSYDPNLPVVEKTNTVEEKVEEKTQDSEKEKYLQAYFNNKYEDVKNSNFSWGTLIFGWIWLVLYKLYSEAWQLFIAVIVAEVIGSIVGGALMFVGFSLLLGGLVVQCASLVVTISYAKEFSRMRIERANKEIDKILLMTRDEEERIRCCKQAGGVNYLALVIIAIVVLSWVAFIPRLLMSQNNAKKEVRENAHAYVKQLDSDISNNKIVPFEGEYQDTGVYYIFINSSSTDLKNYPVRINSSNDETRGYIVLTKKQSNNKYYVCLFNDDKNLFLIGYDDELDKLDPIEDGICDTHDIKIKYPNAMRLVSANN